MNDIINTIENPKLATKSREPLSPDALELVGIINTASDLAPSQQAGLIGAIHNYMDMRRRIITSGEACPDAAGQAMFVHDCMYPVLWARQPKFHGLTPGSMRNVVCRLREVLRRAGRHAPSVRGYANLSLAWRERYDSLPTIERRNGQVRFMGYCSLHDVLPDQVDNLTLDSFETWLGEENLEKPTKIKSLARGTASGWEWARANVGRVRQRGGKSGVAELAMDHAAMVAIWVGATSINGGVSSAIASVCM